MAVRDERWSEAIAVGSLAFVDTVKSELGMKAIHREAAQVGETYTLREPSEAYSSDFRGKTDALRPDNTILWEKNTEDTEI
jgi:putative transposase